MAKFLWLFLFRNGIRKTIMKNRGTNETTESAEKCSVSSKRVLPSPSFLPLWGGEEWNGGNWLDLSRT